MRKNVAGAAGAEKFLRRAAVDAAIVVIAAGLFLSLWASDRAAAGARRGGKSAAVFAPNGDGSVYLGRAKDCAALVCTLSWNAGGLENILDCTRGGGGKLRRSAVGACPRG